MMYVTGKLMVLTLSLGLIGTAVADQKCDSSLPATTPDARFTDNGDGTVTDSVAGLMWKKCLEGMSGSSCSAGQEQKFTWQTALQRASSEASMTSLGYTDWRLPNVKELATIAELRCHSPAANLTVFPNLPADIDVNLSLLWSSSPSTENAFAWGVQFIEGDVAQANKNNIGFVRLVRN